MPVEFKVGDGVMAEFSNPAGLTSGHVTRHAGPIVALSDPEADKRASRPSQAQVKCPGYLAWVDLDLLRSLHELDTI